MLPVAEIDGRIVTESDRILFELEDLYKDRVPLVPTEPAAAERFARLLRLERELFGVWMQWLTSGWSDASNRANFEAVLAAVDQELFVTEGPWFCDDFSLVDIQFVPFLERMVASLLYYKGYKVRSRTDFPGIVAWFEGLEGRAAYVGGPAPRPVQVAGTDMSAGTWARHRTTTPTYTISPRSWGAAPSTSGRRTSSGRSTGWTARPGTCRSRP